MGREIRAVCDGYKHRKSSPKRRTVKSPLLLLYSQRTGSQIGTGRTEPREHASSQENKKSAKKKRGSRDACHASPMDEHRNCRWSHLTCTSSSASSSVGTQTLAAFTGLRGGRLCWGGCCGPPLATPFPAGIPIACSASTTSADRRGTAIEADADLAFRCTASNGINEINHTSSRKERWWC